MTVIDINNRISINVNNGVADVKMTRPDKLNALDTKMFASLVEAGDRLASDDAVRAVVLSGEGRSFCAGLDFSSFQAMADTDTPRKDNGGDQLPDHLEGRITHMGQQSVWTWQEMDKPVIAAVTGHALGAGCQIAMGADIRIVTPDSKFSVLEIRWGLVPDMCMSELLPRLVGVDVAKELYFTGRMVSGTEAVELGMATRTSDDPHGEAMALASEIASKSPDAIAYSKRLVNQFGSVDTAQAFKNERDYIRTLIGSPNQVEAVTAFFEKRDPVFE